MKTAPPIVYHYTDGAGLVGMLGHERPEIWLSHLAYLNDASEFKFAKAIYYEAIQQLGQDTRTDELVRRMATDFLGEVDPALGSADTDVYVASFSSDDDSLGQWRGYSSSGSRYSIGFNVEALAEHARRFGLNFGPVSYGQGETITRLQEEFAAAYLLEHRGREKLLMSGSYERGLGRVAVSKVHRRVIAARAAYCKHHSFQSEHEWRIASTELCHIDELNLRHRAGSSFLVPYIGLPFAPDDKLVSSVRVGPTAHAELSKEAVKSLLTLHGWSDVVVHNSDVPYRD